MRITRQITEAGQSPYTGISWKTVDVEICSADDEQRVCLTDIEVPAQWSLVAAQTFARYYIRRAGVPTARVAVSEEGIPKFLWRHVADTAALAAMKPEARSTHETSARQVFARMAGMWTYWGFKAGYFDTEEDARAFHDELCAMLARQIMAPNSPQWFNAGLHWAYGLTGPAQGHFFADLESGLLRRATSAYERPQLHACFIHAVKDDLVNEGGIMHLFEREARVFKYGSGSGANMSAVRGTGEKLSGGASAQGLMRFLSVGDKAAGAIQAGGMPRRAGKMVVVDIDHPDVLGFVRWKGEEQYKAAALITGARIMRKQLMGIMDAVQSMAGEERFSPQCNKQLAQAITKARRAMIPERAIERVVAYARQGFTDMHIPLYSAADGSDLFFTIAAHQTSQAVRVTDRFMEAAEEGERFATRNRTNGDVATREDARAMLEDIAHAVWATGDPAIHFNDHIQALNPCLESGVVRASTPASEYLFLDDTACPLAAINLLACADARGMVDAALFSHAVRLSTVMLDLTVTIAQYPSRDMARLTLATRPVGLGLVNIAGLLARMGLAYGSDEGRAAVAALHGLLTAEAANCSADLAREIGAFKEFTKNRAAVLKLLRRRRDAMATLRPPQRELADAATRLWEMALIKTEAYGTRNAQLSCVPPTSTIARVMDCETVGLAPLTSALRLQPQAKGGLRKTLTPSVLYGLQSLGLGTAAIHDITRHVCGHGSLANAPGVNLAALRRHGFGDEHLALVEQALVQAVDIHAAFDPWLLGERFCREQLGLSQSDMYNAAFRILPHLGFTDAEIYAANRYACGAPTLDDAPHLSDAQRAAFAAPSPEAQIAMMAAVQQFVTGGIAHTIVLPHETTVEQCAALIRTGWKAGLTSLSMLREGCAIYQDIAGASGSESEIAEPLIFREAVASVAGGVSEVAAGLAQRFVQRRRELPLRRHGFTQKTTIGGQVVYLRTGEYSEGTLGEVCFDLPAESQITRALAQYFSQTLSIALQHGIPLTAFVEAFANPGNARDAASAELAAETHAAVEYLFAELANAYLADGTEEGIAPRLPLGKVAS